jgi:uncharacterized membrane protein YhaH (DUF805 family)
MMAGAETKSRRYRLELGQPKIAFSLCFHRVSIEIRQDDNLFIARGCMMPIVKLFGSWEGRIGRLPYFVGALALGFVFALLTALAGKEGAGFVALLSIYPNWMLAVKRAHDLGKSGWWVFGWSVAFVVGLALLGMGVIILAVPVLLVSAFFTIIKMLFFAGTSGSNQYGPPSTGFAALLNDDAPETDWASKVNVSAAAAPASTMQAAGTPRAAVRPAVEPSPRGLRPAAGAPRAGFGRRGLA